ncbi:hypothetical protein D3C81_2212740 [compost metagenome]
MLISVNDVLEQIEKQSDPKELNRAYKSIIHNVIWTKDDFDELPKVSVNFL